MKKNILKKFIVLFSLGFFLLSYNLTFAFLSIDTSVDVPATCEVKDTDGVSHVYTASSSTSYIAICALQAALDLGSITSAKLSNQYPSLGLFVTSFNDVEADPSSQYWALYQNNDFASLGLSSLPILANDTIVFKLQDFSGNDIGDSVTVRIKSLVVTPQFLSIDTSVDVPATCEVKDTDGVSHVYTTSSSTSYIAICALQAALDLGSITSAKLSNQYPSLGLFVTSFNDVEADPSSQYWALYQNNDFASLGLSSLPILANDTIVFKLQDFSGNDIGDSVTVRIKSLVVTPQGGGGGGGGDSTQTSISITKALEFLSSKQNANGSFGDQLFTDWVAIALSQAGSQAQDMKSKIYNYLKNTPFQSSILTDNERHAMALMSLGINPYSGTSVNYISKIVSSYDGTQFGDASFFNDDIFALIVLANAGYTSNDEMIKKDIEYVISRQSSDGSWGSVDMTGAGIQALRNFMNIGSVPQAVSKGENYLISSQNTDGGFGNSFSTSWALQALSLNSSFSAQIAKADKYLASLQQTDGGIDIISTPVESRIWATAYAIPSTLHLSWNNILQSFSKPTTSLDTNGVSPIVLLQSPIVIEPKEEIKIIDKKIDEIKVSDKETLPKIKKVIVKKPQIIKANINLQDKDTNNFLGASAGGALSDQGIKPSIIHRIVDLIKSPFIWLFKKLGF